MLAETAAAVVVMVVVVGGGVIIAWSVRGFWPNRVSRSCVLGVNSHASRAGISVECKYSIESFVMSKCGTFDKAYRAYLCPLSIP